MPDVFDQAAADSEARFSRALARIRQVSRAGLDTVPAQEAAARLLVDLELAGERHGVDPEEWSAVTHLAGACLDVITGMMRGVDRINAAAAEQGYTSAQALSEHLVDVLHAELVEVHGVASTHRPGTFSLTFATHGGRYRRGVRAGADGWHYDCDGPGLVDSVAAPYTEEGARAVAAVMAAIVAGERPDPLLRGRTW